MYSIKAITLASVVATGFVGPVTAADSVAFFTSYCFDCHDNAGETGGLSLESLAPNYAADGLHETWIRIHDRIRDGEMPPKDQPQPSHAERAAFLKTLDQHLHEASRKRTADGRVTIRRMSRLEYENTLHDLLDIAVDLQSGLPEDNIVQGFDNISSGLATSATHLVSYQQAADRALATFFAMPFPSQKSQTVRVTGREWLEWRPEVYHKNIVPWTYLDGDTFVFRAELWGDNSVFTKPTKLPGRYRYRCSVRARKSNGKPVPFHLARVKVDRFGRQDLEHMLEIADAAEHESRVIEIEVDLPAGESIYISPYRLKHFRFDFGSKPIPADHVGPELAVEWIELEGPLGLGKARKQFVGDLERVPHRFLEQVLAGNRKGLPDWTRWHPNEFSKPHNRMRFVRRLGLQSRPSDDDGVVGSGDPAYRLPNKDDAARLTAELLPRAIRRQPTDEQLAFYTDRAAKLLDDGLLLDEVLLRIYKEILCSTAFLFRIEKPGQLDDYALASRLSYLLWNSMPDDALLDLAAKGELTKPDVLRSQTERMLSDSKARRFLRHFPNRWLNLGEFHEMKPDKLYSEWDEDLAWSMPEETWRYFAEMLTANRPVTEFVHSDWSVLNERLALHYNIDGVEGMTMRKVTLPGAAHRGGVITHASILKLTTNATYTSPIKRGAWVLERIFGTPPQSPPPDVQAIEPDIRGAVTIREQMALHKTQPVCASCHTKIDPPGFALENFDVLGGWRDRYRVSKGGEGIDYVRHPNHPRRRRADWDEKPIMIHVAKPVEASGETSDGKPFANIDEFKQLLLRDPDQIARNLAGQLLVYGTGSELTYADRRSVEQIVATARKDNYGFRTLLHAVIQSETFRTK